MEVPGDTDCLAPLPHRGCPGLSTHCLGPVALGSDFNGLPLHPARPKTGHHLPNPHPSSLTWVMDRQLCLGLLLGSFSAARVASPKSTLIPVALFKKFPLDSCCKGCLAPAHLDSGVPSTMMLPWDPETPTEISETTLLSPHLLSIHSAGRWASLPGQPGIIRMVASVIDMMVALCDKMLGGFLSWSSQEVTS